MDKLSKIKNKIKKSKRYVFEKKDFKDFGNYNQIGYYLSKLVKEGFLIKVSYGLYTKSRINSLTKKPMPSHPFGRDGVIIEVLELKNIDYKFENTVNSSLNDNTNQIPVFIRPVWNKNKFNRVFLI